MMTPHYADDSVTLHLGDALEVLREMEPASVDAVVTDPPYGLEFMGKEWDSFGRDTGNGYQEKPRWGGDRTDDTAADPRARSAAPNYYTAGRPFQHWCEAWARECLRVLRPGGHMLAFGGTRTWHRLTCAIEDAGFEIRDSVADLTGRDAPGLMWQYGSGFPKSLNVSNDVRFCQCDVGELDNGDGDLLRVRSGVSDAPRMAQEGQIADMLSPVQRAGSRPGMGTARPQGAGSQEVPADSALRGGQPGVEGWRDTQAAEGELQGGPLRPLPGGVPADGPRGRLHHGTPARDGSVDRATDDQDGSGESQGSRSVEQRPVESGAISDERGPQAGRGWPLCGRCGKPAVLRGLGTALKPAWEPIVVARKPLAGTVAANVLEHGTGALNIAGCRIGHGADVDLSDVQMQRSDTAGMNGLGRSGFAADHVQAKYNDAGRWPPNVLLGAEAAAELDRQSGVRTSGDAPKRRGSAVFRDCYGEFTGQPDCPPGRDANSGGASRFFPVFHYEPKAGAEERPRLPDGTAHPTVKPRDLIAWLVRLVSTPGALILDPFAGSGTTGEACVMEGRRCVLIEQHEPYCELIKLRLRKPIQPGMFDLESA